MPSALDWLGVPAGPPTSYLNPAIPYRSYGLTAQDAAMQGQDNMDAFKSAAQYADLVRQQNLAPLQQQVTQQQLENQIQVQPLINGGREEMISALSALDPASEKYLEERRNAVMRNPYGLADPVVQEVLRTNDRAYDNYLSTRRIDMMGSAKPLTPMQQASIQKSITQVTESLIKANAMGDAAMAARYAEQLQSLNGMLATGAAAAITGAPTASPAGATVVPTIDTTSGTPSQAQFQNMAKNQRWQTAKELVLNAVEKEAQDSGKTREEIMHEIGSDTAESKRFFQKHLQVNPDALAFEEKTQSWYSSGPFNDKSWDDIFMSLLGDDDLLYNKNILHRRIDGLGTGEPRSHKAKAEDSGMQGQSFTITPK